MNATNPKRNPRRETSSDKTLSVMDLFSAEKPEWTVEEACAELDLSESTAYRYFRSLSAVGLVLSIRPGRYLLGPGIVHYDRQLRVSDPLLRAALPVMESMAETFEGPRSLFVSRIYRDHVMSMHEHRIGPSSFGEGAYARGRLAPLFGGPPGLAILAHMEVRAVRQIFKKSNNDEAAWLETKRQMRTIRNQGFASAHDDPDPGILIVSAPLIQEGGGIAGSLSIALPSTPDSPIDTTALGARLIKAAAETAQRSLAEAAP
jgi:DNA-binding IclR family transcriptional regulator